MKVEIDQPVQIIGSVIGTHRLCTRLILNDVTTSYNSGEVPCRGAREFILYLMMVSAGVSTQIMQLIPQFRSLAPAVDMPTTAQTQGWYSYLQDIWASMFFEDTVMATEVAECYSGKCLGDVFRLRLVGTNTTATNIFTVSAAVEFRY